MSKRDPKGGEAYRAVLEEAIRCRMDPEAPMGTENSGGIDSATITAYLAHFLGEPGDRLHSFAWLVFRMKAGSCSHRAMETAVYDAPYRRTNDFILQHHLTRMQFTARLEDCTLMAAAYGVDYQWPLWDQRLVQQYLSTPGIEKVGPKGMGRYLHRRAIDGIVPKRVAWKPSKDMGYARPHQQMNHTGVKEVARTARQLVDSLHPALEGLIDLHKYREQIARADQGDVDMNFGFFFWRGTHALQWLDAWLKAEN